MWLVSTRGFYSAVEHWDKPDTIVVRARVRKDLVRLCEIEGLKGYRKKIKSTPKFDYKFRVELPRAKWMAAVTVIAMEVDYGNFKNEVAKTDPDRSHGPYMKAWGAFLGLEYLGKRKRQRRRRRTVGDLDHDEQMAIAPYLGAADGRPDYGPIGSLTDEEWEEWERQR